MSAMPVSSSAGIGRSPLLTPRHLIPNLHYLRCSSNSRIPHHISHLTTTMSKLSSGLKALINSPTARPNTVPAPRNIQSVYQHIQQTAVANNVSRPSWLALSTAATMTMNSPDSLTALFHLAAHSQSPAETVAIAELMREVGLKCISFNGIPRTINCLNAFKASLPASVADALSRTPTRTPSPGQHRGHQRARPRPLGLDLPPLRAQAVRQAGRLAPGPARAHPARELRRAAVRPGGADHGRNRRPRRDLGRGGCVSARADGRRAAGALACVWAAEGAGGWVVGGGCRDGGWGAVVGE
ncbi:conserved hypothetical protein [Aspergillus terreus NIH2624]|uniref:Uncharacterized protein n=1 Tax=Aspergillus terreus (strain NIH 2624 / FGSC A1156) TaxID=341663 RepID=Q0CTX6_ASPTN|nr:uncharacterized protein ATEG_02858 [Aspergillus terreus NIH2624]EAU36132.1 conserved hypothetical protein [Aspergillus terreus NIH2624]